MHTLNIPETIRLLPSTVRPATIALPGSKSISNRTLLLAALSSNRCHIRSLLQSDDTDRMLNALEQLGIRIEHTPFGVTVYGNGGHFPAEQADLFLGNAGTAFRPLTAVLALLGGNYRLHGIQRMHERPIGDLADALHIAGAQIDYLGEEGYPPLHIGNFTDSGIRRIPIQGNVSSQFLTALLMALPLTGHAYSIEVQNELISKPYIDITLKLMHQFGVSVQHQHYQIFHIPANSHYLAPETIYVEGDASSASYFLAMGFLSGQPIRVSGVGRNAIQGDTIFAEKLEHMGAHVVWGDNFIEVSRSLQDKIPAFNINGNHIPDAAMTFAIIALAASGRCTIYNIGSWRVKETDRIAAMATELRKVGAYVEEEANAIHITPPEKLIADAQIETYDDHRMAMCFSLVSLLGVPIIINDPQCTRKTFPAYFNVFSGLTCPQNTDNHS